MGEIDWAKTTMPLVPAETAGGMTWQEVKDFLDHIRTTCMDERTNLKLEARHLRAEVLKEATRADGAEAEVWLLREALSLARAMILCGEGMGPLAQGIIEGALHIDRGAPEHNPGSAP